MTTNLKFEIILAYYKRPKIVLNALSSIKEMSYTNWHLTFLDDSGDASFKNTLLTYGLANEKITYVPISDSEEQKIAQGGSRHGLFMNQAILNSNSDIVVILCDDDAIVEGYFEYLDEYYRLNPEINWAYSKVMYYNPSVEGYLQAVDDLGRVSGHGSVVDLNQHSTPINPDCRCDSAQVTFRRKCFVEKDLWYPYPQTKNLDSAMYNKMYAAWGYCYPTFTYGQYKGVFPDQLGCKSINQYGINIE